MHEKMREAIEATAHHGAVDAYELANYLESRGELESVGGLLAIRELAIRGELTAI